MINEKMRNKPKNMTVYKKCCYVRGGTVRPFQFLQGIPQRYLQYCSRIYKRYDESSGGRRARGIRVRESEVSGLLFVDDCVGISDTLEGLKKQIGAAMDSTREWRISINVKKCAVTAYSDSKKRRR